MYLVGVTMVTKMNRSLEGFQTIFDAKGRLSPNYASQILIQVLQSLTHQISAWWTLRKDT